MSVTVGMAFSHTVVLNNKEPFFGILFSASRRKPISVKIQRWCLPGCVVRAAADCFICICTTRWCLSAGVVVSPCWCGGVSLLVWWGLQEVKTDPRVLSCPTRYLLSCKSYNPLNCSGKKLLSGGVCTSNTPHWVSTTPIIHE